MKEQNKSAEILEHDFPMHLIKHSPKHLDQMFFLVTGTVMLLVEFQRLMEKCQFQIPR